MRYEMTPFLWIILCLCMIATNVPCFGQVRKEIELETIIELPKVDVVTIDPKTIIECCSKILDSRMRHDRELIGKALLARCHAFGAMKKFDVGIRDLDDYLALYPENVEALCTRAAMHYELKQCDAGDRDIERAFKLNPKHSDAMLGFASILYRKGREQFAFQFLDLAIALEPNNAQAHYHRGTLYKTVDPIESLKSINRYLELRPGTMLLQHGEPYYYRGFALALLNRTEEALLNYLVAYKLAPHSYSTAQELSLTYRELGKLQLALLYAEKCTKLDPKKPFGHYMSAVCFAKTGKKKDFISASEQFFELSKENDLLDSEKAELLALKGEYEASLKIYDIVIWTFANFRERTNRCCRSEE